MLRVRKRGKITVWGRVKHKLDWGSELKRRRQSDEKKKVGEKDKRVSKKECVEK